MPPRRKRHKDLDPELVSAFVKASKLKDLRKTIYLGTLLGVVIGGILCLCGFVLCLLGLTGTVGWLVETRSFSSRLSNASPGAFFAFLGMIILWRYKPTVRERTEFTPDHYFHTLERKADMADLLGSTNNHEDVGQEDAPPEE